METNQRELFEKWVRSRPEHKRGDLNTRNDEYWDEIALAWRAWQAALASAPAVEAESDVKARITKRLEEYLAWLYSGKDKRPPLASDLANVVCAELQPSATQPDVVEVSDDHFDKVAEMTEGLMRKIEADRVRDAHIRAEAKAEGRKEGIEAAIEKALRYSHRKDDMGYIIAEQIRKLLEPVTK